MLKKSVKYLILPMFLIGVFLVSQSAWATVALENPLGGSDKGPIGLAKVIGKIVNGLLGVIGIISLLYFIIGGFYYLTSAGNPEKVKKGTSTLTWATFGIIVAFTSYAVLQFVMTTLTTG